MNSSKGIALLFGNDVLPVLVLDPPLLLELVLDLAPPLEADVLLDCDCIDVELPALNFCSLPPPKDDSDKEDLEEEAFEAVDALLITLNNRREGLSGRDDDDDEERERERDSVDGEGDEGAPSPSNAAAFREGSVKPDTAGPVPIILTRFELLELLDDDNERA